MNFRLLQMGKQVGHGQKSQSKRQVECQVVGVGLKFLLSLQVITKEGSSKKL